MMCLLVVLSASNLWASYWLSVQSVVLASQPLPLLASYWSGRSIGIDPSLRARKGFSVFFVEIQQGFDLGHVRISVYMRTDERTIQTDYKWYDHTMSKIQYQISIRSGGGINRHDVCVDWELRLCCVFIMFCCARSDHTTENLKFHRGYWKVRKSYFKNCICIAW